MSNIDGNQAGNSQAQKRQAAQEVGHYVVTAHKPSSVLHAIQCQFLSSDHTDVIIAKAGLLEFRQVVVPPEPEPGEEKDESLVAPSLQLVLEVPVRGRICGMAAFRPPGATRDFLFINTERHKYAVLSYQSGEVDIMKLEESSSYSIENILTHDTGMLNDMSVGRESECGPMLCVSPDLKCIAFHLYDGFVKIFPILPNASSKATSHKKKASKPLPVLGPPFTCRLEQQTLLSMVFLNETSTNLVKLAILHQDSKGHQHLATLAIDLKRREIVPPPRAPPSSATTPTPTGGTLAKTPTTGPKKSRVDGGSCLMIPVPPHSPAAAAAAPEDLFSMPDSSSQSSAGGLIIVGQMQIMYISNQGTGTRVLPMDPTLMLCHTELVHHPEPSSSSTSTCYRCLLGDERGVLHLLDLRRHIETGAVTSIHLETMGLTSIPTSILSFQDHGLVYVGSRFGDSQFLQFTKERDPETMSYLQLLEEFTNLGPIVDFDLVDYDRKGRQSQVVTCSGTGRDGSIRLVRNGIGIHEQANVEIPGIKGMWNLRNPNTLHDRYLVQSFIRETRILEMTDDAEMEETRLQGFRHDQPTLYAGNVDLTDASYLVQVTEHQILLVDGITKEAIHTWEPTSMDDDHEDDPKITVASGNASGQIVVALAGGVLTYISVVPSENLADPAYMHKYALKVQSQKRLDHEVSCINLNPFPLADVSCETMDVDGEESHITSSNIVAVGLWNDVSVRLMSLVPETNMIELMRLDLGGDTQARSLLLTTLESNQPPMLLVGLGDGQLISYVLSLDSSSASLALDKRATISSRKKVSLGTQSINLSAFRNASNGNTCVFATGDRPTIVYMNGGKVLYSNINLTVSAEDFHIGGGSGTEVVNWVTSFHCDLFPDCLCLASEETLRIGTIDDIQKLHVQTYPLRETPQRIAHHIDGRTFVVACLGDGSAQAKSGDGAISQGNSLLFLDDTTFEEIDRVILDSFELIMSLVSVPLGNNTNKSFVVAGTGYAYPDEDEPTRGRILVFETTSVGGRPSTSMDNEDDVGGAISSISSSRQVRQVAELATKGGVYSLCGFQKGMLLASVNSMVHLYKLVEIDHSGMVELRQDAASHHGHILSLCVKSSNNQILVGDLMRSLVLLEYTGKDMDEVARDYNPNWTTAVEILSEEEGVYLGAENYNNLFVLRRNKESALEEVQCRLDTQGEYNLGQMVNKFARGSLVMLPTSTGNNSGGGASSGSSGAGQDQGEGGDTSPTVVKVSAGSHTLYGTVDGSIGCILGLDRFNFAFFKTLERCLAKVVPTIGGFKHEEYRAFMGERRLHPSRGFVDGDLIESFLDLSRSQMQDVVKHMNASSSDIMLMQTDEDCNEATESKSKDKVLTVEQVLSVVEEMSRLH